VTSRRGRGSWAGWESAARRRERFLDAFEPFGLEPVGLFAEPAVPAKPWINGTIEGKNLFGKNVRNGVTSCMCRRET
jgi:hypothetical protein